jgi:sarcosine oxidase delta subunit
MVETWEHSHGVRMFYHVRRIPMEALDVETSIAEGE